MPLSRQVVAKENFPGMKSLRVAVTGDDLGLTGHDDGDAPGLLVDDAGL